jgi:transposase InsO family protein
MDQRIQFLNAYDKKLFTFRDLCHAFGISRKTGYKWVARRNAEGQKGLLDRSHAAKTIPHKTDETMEELLLAARKAHPTWGAGKLLATVQKKQPNLDLPARSTVCAILKRNGLTKARRRRPHLSHPGRPQSQFSEPNDLWCADYKGQFRTYDGEYCYPLTITDARSRYLLACQSHLTPGTDAAKEVFTRTFKEFGLPLRIRTDNGAPFASTALSRLSTLSVWWIRLGITPELIEPGRPQQNGLHERMHRTLKAEATRPPGFDIRGQQRKFNRWREEYNHERPHEALNQVTPASIYKPSEREMPSKLPDVEYPGYFDTRLVSANGGIRWGSLYVRVSVTLKGEYIGLEPVDEGIWVVYYSHVKLGYFDERKGRIEDELGRLFRKRV